MISAFSLLINEPGQTSVAEAYNTLRANLSFCKPEGNLKTILFTSAGPQEGKSLIAANTAIALAQTGKLVVIVDCDLRRPVQHQIFGRQQNSGVTTLLADKSTKIDEVIQTTNVNNLFLLPSGPLPPNPPSTLGSDSMGGLIAYLREKFDSVVIDTPPVIAAADACILASATDGVVLVLDSDVVRPEMAQKAKELLLKAKGNLLGVVLNRVEIAVEYAGYYKKAQR
jgi:capsular exopolysaccharide synthesis family protein